MKYANVKTDKEALGIRAYLAFHIASIIVMIGMFFLNDEEKQRDAIIYWIIVGSFVVALVYLGFMFRTYKLSDLGVTEQVWFINHVSKWSDYYAWESFEYRGEKYICAYKTKKIPILKRESECYIPKTFPMTFIRYTEERYEEFKGYAEKNHIPELHDDE